MQDWFNTTMQNLQAGDIGTVIAVLLGILVFFFITKILLNTIKAILIIAAVIILVSFFMPEANILEKAKDMTESASDFIKDKTQNLSQ